MSRLLIAAPKLTALVVGLLAGGIATAPAEAQLKKGGRFEQGSSCVSCHADVGQGVAVKHAPLVEDGCTACHKPHGLVGALRLTAAEPALCLSCHDGAALGTDAAHRHPDVERCSSCHDPHGSSNERMLVAKPPLLCQRCHVATRHPSTIYDAQAVGSATSASIRIYARSCVACHSAIHGSNHPSGQRFIR